MEKKIIFLDVDGTLCNEVGKVPPSARAAVRAARANGHQVYLCTGRSKAELVEDVMSVAVDGIIGAGGGYVEHQEEVLLHRTFAEDSLKELLAFLLDAGVEYYLESNQGLFASPGLKEKLMQVTLNGRDPESAEAKEMLEATSWFMDLLEEDQTKIDYTDVNKVSFINDQIPYEVIHQAYHGEYRMMRSTVPAFGKDSGEIALKGINKQSAMELLLAHLGRAKAQTLAFGDGNNDLDMFAAAQVGIAMGNACDELKAVADEVTTTPDDHGIARSLVKHGLINEQVLAGVF